jgi:transposase
VVGLLAELACHELAEVAALTTMIDHLAKRIEPHARAASPTLLTMPGVRPLTASCHGIDHRLDGQRRLT